MWWRVRRSDEECWSVMMSGDDDDDEEEEDDDDDVDNHVDLYAECMPHSWLWLIDSSCACL